MSPHRRVAVWVSMAIGGLAIAASASTGGDADWFLHLGRTGPALGFAQEVIGADVDVPQRIGHDGASFWVVARDPLLTDPDELEPLLDRPSYRARRVGYPILVAPWRLGGEDALLWGMVITNVVAVLVAGLAAADLAVRAGAPPIAVATVGLNPAVLVAVLFDLGDAVALAALLVAVAAALRRRTMLILLASAVVGLSRESFAIGLVGLAVLGSGLDRRTRLLLVAPAVVTAIAWAAYVQLRLGGEGGSLREVTIIPFDGWVEAWRRSWSESGDWGSAFTAIALGAAAAATVALFVRRRTTALAVAVPFAFTVPFLTIHVVDLPHNLVRAIGPLLTLVTIDVLAARHRVS